MSKKKYLEDSFGRSIDYLRLSITDRCNFRCKYCMPSNDFEHIDCEEILSYEDFLFITEVFASLGVTRLRITGGEPLVRKGVMPFLNKVTKIEGINEVMITTNGALLEKHAEELLSTGVKRLNISLDSLRKDRFNEITGRDAFDTTLKGILKARDVGFKAIKVNVVLIRGFNDDELDDFAKFASKENIIIRFIEFMPVGNSSLWGKENIITGDEILERLKWAEPEKLIKDKQTGPAENYKLNNGATIGIITPISKHFCNECDKLRVTSDGKIRSCLLSDDEVDIKAMVRLRDREKTINAIYKALDIKGKEHSSFVDGKYDKFKRTMSKIGG